MKTQRTLAVRPGQLQLPALVAEKMPHLDSIPETTPESRMERQARLGRELFDACMVKDVEKTWSLIKDGADVDERDHNGWTPLMWAAVPKGKIDRLYGFETIAMDEADDRRYPNMRTDKTCDTINLLLKSRADRTLKNKDGDTAADIARREGCAQAVKLLERIYTAD
ncbi:MAG: ankyrin repeat domain-containing protein [Candidatus Micrarchaeota archaeon]